MFSEWYYNVIHRYFLVPWRLDVWSLWYNMIKMPLHFDFAKSYKIGTKYENLQEQSLRWVNTFNSGHSYVRNDRSTFFYATRNRCREKVPHVWLGNSWNNGQFRDVYLNFSVVFAPILLIKILLPHHPLFDLIGEICQIRKNVAEINSFKNKANRFH